MPKVKYCVTEFTPTANQIGMSHSFSAKVVINSDIDGDTLAERVAKRSGFKDYECKAIMAAFAEIIQEEALESNRVSLCNTKGEKLVSIYPRVQGSISDKDVQANPTKYPGKTRAEEGMLTADMLTWGLGATIGIKFSKKFAIEKQAQKVAARNVTVIDDEGNTSTENGGSSSSEQQPADADAPVLTIAKTGTGTMTVTDQTGHQIESGAAVTAGQTLTLAVTPAGSATPTATIGSQTVTLTEDEGQWVGTFQMPAASATLTVRTGGTGDNEE